MIWTTTPQHTRPRFLGRCQKQERGRIHSRSQPIIIFNKMETLTMSIALWGSLNSHWIAAMMIKNSRKDRPNINKWYIQINILTIRWRSISKKEGPLCLKTIWAASLFIIQKSVIWNKMHYRRVIRGVDPATPVPNINVGYSNMKTTSPWTVKITSS